LLQEKRGDEERPAGREEEDELGSSRRRRPEHAPRYTASRPGR